MALTIRPINFGLEIGGAVFGSFNTLCDLIAVSSGDDVHTQAVLAVEQLGACIPAAPERIGEAVNALGGRDSVRVQNLKAYIGIASGGLRKMMRQSTPLLQFFTFCAACKTTLVDDESATLLFEMLKMSNVLAKLPCSAVQISRMINHFSGQAEIMAPIEFMHEIALVVDEWLPKPETFGRMDVNILAELLLGLFEQMRDEAVDNIVLVGHQNSIWLASSLLWLFGKNSACLLMDDKIIKGDPTAKLCIEIDPQNNIPWNMQVFKKDGDPIQYIYETTSDEIGSLTHIPLRLLKSFMTQYFWSTFEDQELRKKAMTASGIIAQTLIVAISQCGLLYLKCESCSRTRDWARCNQTPLASIVKPRWLATLSRAITSYGWSDEDKAETDLELLTDIVEAVSIWRHQTQLSWLVGKVSETPEKSIKEVCYRFIRSYFSSEKVEVDYILDPALFIAADATVTATASFENGGRFIKPLDNDNATIVAGETVANVLGSGLEVSEFRELAFRQLLPGLDSWHDDDLVVARDGYVVGMNMLWHPSSRKSDALSIRVQRGQIRKGRVAYSSIRESAFHSVPCAGPRVPAFDRAKGFVLPDVGWQHPIQDRAYTFETSTSTHGSRICIKQFMLYTNGVSKIPHRRRASWIGAIHILATATHMDLESRMTANLSNLFHRSMTQHFIAKDVCWTDPFCSPQFHHGARTLIRTGADNKVKIFSAGACDEPRDRCCQIIVRHRAFLLECIDRAEASMRKGDMSWIVVD